MEENCLDGEGRESQLAWEPVGEYWGFCVLHPRGHEPDDMDIGQTKSLGVFFWATDSVVNRRTPFRNLDGEDRRVDVSALLSPYSAASNATSV